MAECSKGVNGDANGDALSEHRNISVKHQQGSPQGFSLLGRNQEMYRHRIHALHNRVVEYVEAKVMHR